MVKAVNFIVAGEPQGKARPRFNTHTGHAVTPLKTANYEALTQWEYNRQCAYKFPDDAMLSMNIKEYYSVPKSDSKKLKERKLSGKVRPTKKPDMDNVIKIIADALNTVAYRDDTQIVDCQCGKFYSDNPRVEVMIQVIETEK